jgi:hypothetical protein
MCQNPPWNNARQFFYKWVCGGFHSMKTSKIFNTLWVLEKSLKMFFFSPTNKIDTFPKPKRKRKHSLKRRPVKYQTAKNWEGIWSVFILIHVLKMSKVNLEFFKKKSWARKPFFHWLNELSKVGILVSVWEATTSWSMKKQLPTKHPWAPDYILDHQKTLELQFTFSWGTINKNPWTLGCILDH